MKLTYTNHRGERRTRNVLPNEIVYEATDFHTKPQWIMRCFDVEKDAPRDYALEDCDFTQTKSLTDLQHQVHETAKNAGWYRNRETGEPIERNVGEVIALMHSELSEALEAYRKDEMDDKLPHRPGIEVEFADAIIRILDTAQALGLDIEAAIIEKDEYNRKRSDHKLSERNKPGGKKF